MSNQPFTFPHLHIPTLSLLALNLTFYHNPRTIHKLWHIKENRPQTHHVVTLIKLNSKRIN
jgi:hypothetical protein